MKIKIDKQMTVLAALRDQVKDQVTEMQRLEVYQASTVKNTCLHKKHDKNLVFTNALEKKEFKVLRIVDYAKILKCL